MVGIIKFGAVLFLPLVASASPSLAQSQARAPFDTTKAVPYYTPTAVGQALRAMGHTVQSAQAKSGNTYLQVVAKNGFKFHVYFSVCKEGKDKCKGLIASAFWTQPDDFSVVQMIERTRKFNNSYGFVNSGLGKDGRLYMRRFSLAEYGTNQGNIRGEIRTFISLGSKFTAEVFAK